MLIFCSFVTTYLYQKNEGLIKTVYTGHSELPIYYCCSYVRGCRNEQEDAHTLAKLIEYKKKKTNVAFFGVFDGHSGAGTSNYCANNLLSKYLLAEDKDAADTPTPATGDAAKAAEETKQNTPKEVTDSSNEEELGDYICEDNRVINRFLKCEHDIVFDEKDNLGLSKKKHSCFLNFYNF